MHNDDENKNIDDNLDEKDQENQIDIPEDDFPDEYPEPDDYSEPEDEVSEVDDGINTQSAILDSGAQMGIIKLALEEDFYCTQLIKYLYDDEAIKKKSKILFAHENLTELFYIIAEAYKEFEIRPNPNVIKQKIHEIRDVRKKEDLYETFEMILDVNIDRAGDAYKKILQALIQQIKMARGVAKMKNMIVSDPGESIHVMEDVLDDVNKVSFDEDDVVSMDDVPSFLVAASKNNDRKIPTGIPELDEDLVGGLPVEALTIALAGTNTGKSIFCTSIGANALRAGYKVLHINLEGMRDESIMRYTSNLAKVRLGDILRGDYGPEETKRIEETVAKYGPDKLKVRNMLGFGATIEELAAICKEEHKTFKFNVLVVDYGQLLETSKKGLEHRFVQARVHKGLDSLAKEFSCVCITPVQATRGSQSNENSYRSGNGESDRAPVLQSGDISESYDIARVAAVILTLNITPEEREQGRLRVFLEKQRQGVKGKVYGLLTDFPTMNLIPGKTFNPYSIAHQGELDGDTIDTANETFSLSLDGKSHEQESQKEIIDKLIDDYKSLKVKSSAIKSEYNDAKDEEDYDKAEELSAKLEMSEDKILSKEEKIIEEFDKVYPKASMDDYEEIKKQYRDMKESGDGDIKSVEKILERYKYGFGKG